MYEAFRRAVAQDASFQVSYPGVDVGAVFDSWVQNPGAPVVNVNVNMDNGVISIAQVFFCLFMLLYKQTSVPSKTNRLSNSI